MNEEQTKIDNLKRIIDSLDRHGNSIQLLLSYFSKPLLIDDRGLNNILKQLITLLSSPRFDQIFQEMKYIGSRLYNIENDIKKIKEQGIRKSIHLEFTCDGYELVKKPLYHDKQDPIEEPNDTLRGLLKTILPNEATCVIHRLGLLGEKEKTFVEIGKILDLSRGRVSQIYSKAIRKLRHPDKSQFLNKISNKKLRKAVLDEDKEGW